MIQSGMVRGSYRNGVARRQQIIEKAAELFASVGYHGGSLRQIAFAVGVTPAALSRHFASKEDVLVSVMEWWRVRTDALTGDDFHGLAFFGELRRLLHYHVANRGLLELFLTLATESSNPNHPAAPFLRARYAETVNRFAAEIHRATELDEIPEMSAEDAESEARTVIAMMDGIELQWLLNSEVDLVGLFDRNVAHTIQRWREGIS